MYVNSYKPFLGLPRLVLDSARAVMEELQRLLEEANGMMHEDLRTRLGNIALIEGAGGSETTQTADTGQGANFVQRADTGQSSGGHEQVHAFCKIWSSLPNKTFWTGSKALNLWLE